MEVFALKVGVGHAKARGGSRAQAVSGHSHLSFLFHVDLNKMARPGFQHRLALKSPKRYRPSVLSTFDMASSKAA